MSERILNVKVGEGIETGLAHAAQVMEALDRGERVAPHFGVGFDDMSQMFAVFTHQTVGFARRIARGRPYDHRRTRPEGKSRLQERAR